MQCSLFARYIEMINLTGLFDKFPLDFCAWSNNRILNYAEHYH